MNKEIKEKIKFWIPIITLFIAAIGIIINFYILPINNEKLLKSQINTQWTLATNFENNKQYDEEIEILNQIIKDTSNKEYPYEYAKTQLYLGQAYVLMSDNKNQKTNLVNSINSFRKL